MHYLKIFCLFEIPAAICSDLCFGFWRKVQSFDPSIATRKGIVTHALIPKRELVHLLDEVEFLQGIRWVDCPEVSKLVAKLPFHVASGEEALLQN